ncbi:YciI family protein [Rathayibacter sp. CAU 1779]
MAEYLMLVHPDPAFVAPAPGTEVSSPYRSFMETYADHLLGGAALTGPETATSVRTDADGNITVTDGVFVESKEVLGGYWVLQAADLDEAISIAKQVPVRNGGIELRPIAIRS